MGTEKTTDVASSCDTVAAAARESHAGGVSRRGFLNRAGGVATAAVTTAAVGGLPLPIAPVPARAAAARSVPAGSARAAQAYAIRESCAADQRKHIAQIATNGDELTYGTRIGNFAKGLPHNSRGEVDPAAYAALLGALASASPADFEAIPMGGKAKFANPQGAFAYMLEGIDSAAIQVPPPPAFNSAQEAGEMVEMYWQALARDVPFADYTSNALLAQAATDLSRLSDLRAPKTNGAITPAAIFRAGLPGELAGPYVSQFLWQPVPYGAMTIAQRYLVAPGKDFMTTYESWLTVLQGRYAAPPSVTPLSPPPTRYVTSGRDLATFLHADFTYQAYLNAALILIKLGALDAGNPYLHSKNQTGVGTFGPHHLLDLVAKAANAAVKASWYHKWLVHRRLRPEEFGGRVNLHRTGVVESPIHADLLYASVVLDAVYQKYGTYLLPIAYPEGAPMHPSYPAAHCSITGACVTILKAFFDEAAVLPNPVLAVDEGRTLQSYSGPALTVGGELNKLAGNLAMGRAFGSVHWRSDNIAGLQLGEAVAIGILADERRTYSEKFGGFSLTTFDGTTITV